METLIRSPYLSGKPRRVPACAVPEPPQAPAPEPRTDSPDDRDTRPQPGGRVAADTEPRPSPAPGSSGPQNIDASVPVKPAVDAEVVRRLGARAEAAERQLQEFEASVEEARRLAAEQGHAEGYLQGMETGRNEYRKAVDALRALEESVSGQLDKLVMQAEDAAVEVVYASVLKILGQALLKPEGVAAVVNQVLEQVTQRDRLIICVSPADHEILTAGREELPAGAERTGVEWLPDERVTLGGCLLDTSAGQLDGRLEVQLQRLRDVLLEVRRQQTAGDSGLGR